MPTLAPKCFTKSYIQLLPAFAKLAFAQNDTALNRSATLWNIKCLHIIFGELSFSFWAILLFSVKPPTRDIHLGKFNIWTKMSGAFGIGINITERLNNFRLTLCCRGLAFSFYLTLCCFYALPIPLMDLHQMLHSTTTFGDDDDALRVWIILKRLNPSDGICHSSRLADIVRLRIDPIMFEFQSCRSKILLQNIVGWCVGWMKPLLRFHLSPPLRFKLNPNIYNTFNSGSFVSNRRSSWSNYQLFAPN